MKRIIVITFITGITVLTSCVSPEEWGDKFENIVPEPISNVQVENLNGGAKITYTLPSVEGLLGVKAIYSLTPGGKEMELYASAGKDTIQVEGYGDTDERTVTVYVVHQNGNLSTGVPVTIKPLTPAISVIRETLKAVGTFGGVQITWDNPLRKDMGIGLYVEDSITHEMVLFDQHFSNAVVGRATFRPFKAEEQIFRIEMFDKWKNFAQPLETRLTPVEEIEIMGRDSNGNIWSLFDDGRVVANDASTPWRFIYRCEIHNALHVPRYDVQVFELVLTWQNPDWWHPGNQFSLNDYVPESAPLLLPFPLCFTIDMGRKAVYSRLKFIARQLLPYQGFKPVEFNVWGCNDPKLIEDVEDPHGIYPKGSREANQAYWSSWEAANGTGAWKNDWVKLAECKIVLSTGDNVYYDGMVLSDEDLARERTEGWEFDFNMGVTEPFRYLRWEVTKTSADQRFLNLTGMKYWGVYAD